MIKSYGYIHKDIQTIFNVASKYDPKVKQFNDPKTINILTYVFLFAKKLPRTKRQQLALWCKQFAIALKNKDKSRLKKLIEKLKQIKEYLYIIAYHASTVYLVWFALGWTMRKTYDLTKSKRVLIVYNVFMLYTQRLMRIINAFLKIVLIMQIVDLMLVVKAFLNLASQLEEQNSPQNS